MKCLRIYAGPDGESHFADVEIPLTSTEFFPGVPPLRVSAQQRATSVQFITVPAGLQEAGWHNPPELLLAIWLSGEVELKTSDGEIRRLDPGGVLLAEDIWGRGHISRHPEQHDQEVILIPVPDGYSRLERPTDSRLGIERSGGAA